MLSKLEKLKNERKISLVDYHFAKLIDEKQNAYNYTESQKKLAVILAAMLSYYVREGNTCIKLNQESEMPFKQLLEEINLDNSQVWQTILQDHIAFSSSPDKIAPFYFQHNALYLHRYWQAERSIADYLLQAVRKQKNIEKNTKVEQAILSRFVRDESDEYPVDWQLLAVANSIIQHFCLISGGPGTGKTTTVAKLLTAMQLKQLQQNAKSLKVALVAPTGKAASRMKESLEKELRTNILNQENPKRMVSLNDEECAFIENNMPKFASTIHRLIGIRPFQALPKYHQKNPLDFDLIVVDEASMIDLFLMDKLLQAIKSDCHLVLLGDKDQLPPVEAGALLSELGKFLKEDGGYSQSHSDYLAQITGYEKTKIKFDNSSPALIADCLCQLYRSRRFDEKSLIGKLAKLTNQKNARDSWLFLKENSQKVSDAGNEALMLYPYQNQKANIVIDKAISLYKGYLEEVKKRNKDPNSVEVKTIFDLFNQVRFLSALRVGEFGSEFLNKAIAEALKQKNLVIFNKDTDNYIGKPILITQNAPNLNLYSGDIGIILPDEEKKPRVYFDTMIDGKRLSISPNRLPSYETAYVMTVHKSQGSEFMHTLLVMPDFLSPVLNKELVYTAITRARKQFSLFCNKREWDFALSHSLNRQSCLEDMLK